jgi:hypothetical protein
MPQFMCKTCKIDYTLQELTPEFFYMPEFLVNANEFQFGLPDNGNVTLPPWAKGSPDLFIAKHREALESEYLKN